MMRDDKDLDRLLRQTSLPPLSEAALTAMTERIVRQATQTCQSPPTSANDRYWLAGLAGCVASIMIGFMIGQGQISLIPDHETTQDLALLGSLVDAGTPDIFMEETL